MRLDAKQTDRVTAEMGVPNHNRLGPSHAGPALQGRMVLVNHRRQHSADVKWLLTPRVGLVRENVSDTHEAAGAVGAVRISLHVAVNGVAGCGTTGKTLARKNVGMLVMAEQDMTGLIDVAGKILRLAVWPHDAIIATNSLIVFGRDAARVIESALAGKHHGARWGHD